MKFDSLYGLWWPNFETGFEEVRNYIIRRVTDVEVVMKEVRTHGIAVQAGGHVGLFPRQLAKHFAFVWSFEAIPETCECMKLNIAQHDNILGGNVALGATMGTAQFSARRSGRSQLQADGDISVEQITIDSLQLPRCDLIYLDIEGSELAALEGAKETIAKYRPVVVLEVLKGRLEKTMEWVSNNKYNIGGRIHNDRIFTP